MPDHIGGRILVVEDDEEIRKLIIAQLQREPYDVSSASTVSEAEDGIAQESIDLIVLDLNLPDGDGLALCRQLRARGYEGAIIMVTARDAPLDRVLGLELGADDYLTKPFEPREFLARTRNLLRRTRTTSPEVRPRNARIARFGGWRLDLHQRRLISSDERLVMLSAAEYRLLGRFLDAPSQVLSREELLPERSATVAYDRSLDLQISRLRHKLASETGGEGVILTVRHEGYMMPGPVHFE
ncbi:MAG: response regulator transcription factor [Caulobacteraceae bacterium]